MHAFQIEQLVEQRIQERHSAAVRHALAKSARRTKPDAAANRQSDQRTGHLAHDLATLGPRAVELNLARYARDARDVGAAPLPLAILTDPSMPDVVRQRAYAHVVASLQHSCRSDRVAA